MIAFEILIIFQFIASKLQFIKILYIKGIVKIVTPNGLKPLTKRSQICNIWFSLYTKLFILN